MSVAHRIFEESPYPGNHHHEIYNNNHHKNIPCGYKKMKIQPHTITLTCLSCFNLMIAFPALVVACVAFTREYHDDFNTLQTAKTYKVIRLEDKQGNTTMMTKQPMNSSLFQNFNGFVGAPSTVLLVGEGANPDSSCLMDAYFTACSWNGRLMGPIATFELINGISYYTNSNPSTEFTLQIEESDVIGTYRVSWKSLLEHLSSINNWASLLG